MIGISDDGGHAGRATTGRGRTTTSRQAWATYLVLGAGVLLPWNAFVSTTYDRLSSSHVDRLITVVYLPVTLVSTLTLAVTCGELSGARPRLLSGFGAFAACLFLAPLFIDVHSLGGLLSLVAVAGVADAAAQGALFGLAGEGGDEQAKVNTQRLVSGTSVSGIVTSVLNIVTRVVFAEDTAQSMCYFWTTAALCAGCAVLCARLGVSPSDKTNILIPSTPTSASTVALTSTTPTTTTTITTTTTTTPTMEPLHVETPQQPLSTKPSILGIFGKARAPLCALTAVYWVTITIFPGILQENVARQHGAWTAPLATFLFNVCDAAGKFLEPLPVTSNTALLALTASRTLFVPAFLAATDGPHAALICFLASCLGLTNGMLTVTTLTKIQRDVDEADEYLAGSVSLAMLLLGLNLGAITSWGAIS